MMMQYLHSCLFTIFCLLAITAVTSADENPKQEAERIFEATGVSGGFVVHLGAGEGRLTAALGQRSGCVLQGLDCSPENVKAARDYITSRGLYGRVSADVFDGTYLPYKSNIVNLIIAGEPGEVPLDEMLRVLSPGGVAYVRANGTWSKTVKSRPGNVDEWTHFFHDPSGNAVANDLRVGPPRGMQWLADPAWQRSHHHLNSVSALVTAKGRIFYIVDSGPADSMLKPSEWAIVARDAYSGVRLWERELSTWASVWSAGKTGIVQLGRTLVTDGDRVFLPMGESAPVVVLDAVNGKTLATYPATDGAEELVYHRGVLYVVCGAPRTEWARVSGARSKVPTAKRIVAVDAASGDTLWVRSNADSYAPCTLAAEGGRVFFHEGDAVIGLDARTGEEHWRGAMPTSDFAKKLRRIGSTVATLQVTDGVVVASDRKTGFAFDASDGRELWERALPKKPNMGHQRNIFVIDGLVWVGPDFLEGWGLRTGTSEVVSSAMHLTETLGHHDRCYWFKATSRYIIAGKRGLEFLDLSGDAHSRNNWARGACQYGVMPANGLVYAPPHACGCYMEAKLRGFWALAPEAAATDSGAASTALQKGPGFAWSVGYESASSQSDGWPTLRRDALRSGVTSVPVPSNPTIKWKTKIGAKISAPVVAEGKLVVADIDGHSVIAMDAESGTLAWEFTAGGRVDSPPTLFKGRALFGCADGTVYCLRLTDGALAWRFRAAPSDRRAISRNQVESLWPVHGSVLILKGVAYASAGRSSYLDGGIHLYGLDPKTGKVLYQARIESEHPVGTGLPKNKPLSKDDYLQFTQNAVDTKTLHAPDKSDGFSMEGARSDVLVSDGDSLYLRQMRFDPALQRRNSFGAHLFSTSSLLDGAENHRSHWVLGGGNFERLNVAYSWMVNNPIWRASGRLQRPYGLMLCFDDKQVWGIWKEGHWGIGEEDNPKAYTLYMQRQDTVIGEEMEPDFVKLAKKRGGTRGSVLPEWVWSHLLDMHPRALALGGKRLILCGYARNAKGEGLDGTTGVLRVISAADGAMLSECSLPAPPVWDGIAAAGGRIYLATEKGEVCCLSDARKIVNK